MVWLLAFLPAFIEEVGLGDAGRLVFGILRWPVLALLMVLALSTLYRLAVSSPEERSGWRGLITPGAIAGTALWLVVSVLFSFYTANFASYSKTYGTLASIVVVLLWLFLHRVGRAGRRRGRRHPAGRADSSGCGSSTGPTRCGGPVAAFDAAGYTLDAVTERLGPHVFAHLSAGELAPLVRATRAGDRLDVLARLFLVGEPVILRDARAALAPLPVEQWAAGGLVAVDGDEAKGLAGDPPARRSGGSARRP